MKVSPPRPPAPLFLLVWFQSCFLGSNFMVMAQVTCCCNSPVLVFVVVVVCWVGVGDYWLYVCACVCVCVSPTLPLSPWAVTRFNIYCTGQSATGSTETERERERGEGKKCRARDSLLLSHPPLYSPTLSTQRLLAATHGSTAPLQWSGGRENYSSLFTN